MMFRTIIDTDTIYMGDEFVEFMGARVRIRAIMHSDMHPDPDKHTWIVSDAVLAYIGGMTPLDRVEVALLRHDGRPGVIHFAPRAVDLARFATLLEEELPETLRSPDEGNPTVVSQTSKEAS